MTATENWNYCSHGFWFNAVMQLVFSFYLSGSQFQRVLAWFCNMHITRNGQIVLEVRSCELSSNTLNVLHWKTINLS